MSCIRRTVWAGAWLAVWCLSTHAARGQDAQKPELKLATPLVIVPGTTTRVTLRGLRLDQASEVRAIGLENSAKITLASKAASAPPNGLSPERVGDTEVQIDLELAADCGVSEIPLVVMTPAGESMPLAVRVMPSDSLVQEQEPNDGYRMAQPAAIDQFLVGSIHEPKNVDVFRITASTGQVIVAEWISQQAHSPLDPFVHLCDAQGRILVTVDDQEMSRDPVLRWNVPRDGDYLLCVMDANDTGSPLHQYLMRVRMESAAETAQAGSDAASTALPQ